MGPPLRPRMILLSHSARGTCLLIPISDTSQASVTGNSGRLVYPLRGGLADTALELIAGDLAHILR